MKQTIPGEQPACRRGWQDDRVDGHRQGAAQVGGGDCQDPAVPGDTRELDQNLTWTFRRTQTLVAGESCS